MKDTGKFVPGKTTKHMEDESYRYAGVEVRVRIDYDRGIISLLESNGGVKKWVFAEREIEYMQGWQNILDAMKYAIEQATKKLAAHQKAAEKEKTALQVRVMKAAIKERVE